ncbi:hypothetical protein GCM10027022_20720 [Alpinimonas psychrophila]|uniref:Cardiolipin synthase N-terminal domain-containing protein n=1 Tax=Alpinimonas psychrophila TaxID=748908 RepID=A0A7W3JV56_9MICO|nr:hypothetical protein [Alpinimonas psychrophila]
METFAIVAAILAGALYLATITYVITQITRTSGLNPTEKAIWVVAILTFPLVGTIVWFVLGPHPFGIRVGDPTLK